MSSVPSFPIVDFLRFALKDLADLSRDGLKKEDTIHKYASILIKAALDEYKTFPYIKDKKMLLRLGIVEGHAALISEAVQNFRIGSCLPSYDHIAIEFSFSIDNTTPVVVPKTNKRKSTAPPLIPIKSELPASQYRIVLSNFLQGNTLRKYETIVTKLGGLLEADISPQTTHVVTPNISGSAKCAGGKWIVTPQFLDDSEKVDCFVDEVPNSRNHY